MNVGGLIAHGLEQLDFVALYGKGGELDARAIRRQTPHDPASTQPHPGVGASYGLIEDLLIQNPIRYLAALCEYTCRRNQRLGLARDFSAVPHGDTDISLPSEAADAGHAMHEYMRRVGLGQHAGNRLLGAAGDLTLNRCKAGQLRPKL